ncbi:transcription termination/antitermination NusG family protein [Methylobacterium nodulans]|uniref:NusG antitermination factor n=1 Tax=Methylobacterium nodulans (strain LMG 21967 / CNCM I-2342 / ORS 2060) TaxID=460265 RepID=B8INV2_METNO|nr:transcription termination/antitermination NusG family protein [Methylobacterium nodulans]ACL58468.1 NusG antitermination factor [Methylobacterium nodulans ORS 2060]
MIDQAKTWFVVQTGPARERRVVELLAREGADTWLPLFRVTTVRRGRKVDDFEKVFASYVFAGLDEETMRRRGTSVLFDCDHVLDVLGVDRPLPFPADALQVLADRLAGHNRDETEEGRRRTEAAKIQVGEMRRIINGPFMSFFAEVEEVLSNGIIKAGVRIFGRITPVEFTPDQLDAA